jgi:hypothetical protein
MANRKGVAMQKLLCIAGIGYSSLLCYQIFSNSQLIAMGMAMLTIAAFVLGLMWQKK